MNLRTLPALGLLATGCAGPALSPEEAERQKFFADVLEPCKRQYPSIHNVEVDQYGHIYAEAYSWSPAVDGFKECAQKALFAAGGRKPIGVGKLAAAAGNANVALQPLGTRMVVQVHVNDTPGTFLLDTGAGISTVTPAFAARAGIVIKEPARRIRLTAGGGGQFMVPVVTAKSMRIGDAAVEGIDVAVFDGVSRVDGLLGADYLRHFRMTIDRNERLLILEVPKALSSTEINTPPRFLTRSCERPSYPDESRSAGESGTVELRLIVNEAGEIVESKVMRSSGHERLDSAARTSLQLCKFEPATRNTAPRSAPVILEYVWSLTGPSGVRVPPAILPQSCEKPEYPEDSRRLNQQGKVLLRFFIDESGTVAKREVARSSGYDRLDEAAASGLSLCKFTPATFEDMPTSGWARIEYVFRFE